ncbi:MAG: PorV/PorQ family protein [candidate division Zixibacteria bacterium]|nr:PorV/PorQ family protein [candidate division Zixibacteria bacterium]
MKSIRSFIQSFSILAFSLLLSISVIHADEFNPRVGTRAFTFLKSPIGARAVAMGGAFTGLADDESALYYNPAGTVSQNGSRLIIGYQNFMAGIQKGFLGYIKPLGPDQKIGVFINYLDYGDFIRTDITGLENGIFGGGSVLLGANYSRQVSEKLQLGANFKLLYSKVDAFTATGAAIDLGAKYIIRQQSRTRRDRGFGSIGFSIQNLGSMLSTYVDNAEKDPLPLTFRLGAGGQPRGVPLILSGDIIKSIDNDFQIAVGSEYTDASPIILRLGWSSFGSNYRTTGNDSKLAGFSFGAGFIFDRMQISYSITPMNDLGETHRITVTRDLR